MTSKYYCSVVVVLLSFIPLNTSAQAPGAAKPNAQSITTAIENAFGSAVEPVTGFNPYFVTGDFNGDRVQDIAVVVRFRQARSALPKKVRVINPFGYGAVSNNTSILALAIIHGDQTGWQTSPVAEKFIVRGESPILILQSARATGGDESKSLMSLKPKRARRARHDPWPPRAARGDGIVLETEATNSILYWDGTTYRWLEGEGGE